MPRIHKEIKFSGWPRPHQCNAPANGTWCIFDALCSMSGYAVICFPFFIYFLFAYSNFEEMQKPVTRVLDASVCYFCLICLSAPVAGNVMKSVAHTAACRVPGMLWNVLHYFDFATLLVLNSEASESCLERSYCSPSSVEEFVAHSPRYACAGRVPFENLPHKSLMTPYTWAEKFVSFERINSIRETNWNFDSWEPVVYMSCTSQNFRLFHVSNLSVRNFRTFCSCIGTGSMMTRRLILFIASVFTVYFGSCREVRCFTYIRSSADLKLARHSHQSDYL